VKVTTVHIVDQWTRGKWDCC